MLHYQSNNRISFGGSANFGVVSQEELAQFLAQPVPRNLTQNIKNASAGRISTIIVSFLFGSFVICFGLLVVSIVAPLNILDDWLLDSNGVIVRDAQVTDVKETKTRMNGTLVYGSTFVFRTQDGKAVTAESFSTGRRWVKDQRVTARYLPSDPKIAKIDGGRRDVISWVGLFVFIFPIAGLLIMFLPLWYRRRKLRLMERGRLLDFEILSVEATAVSINEERIHKITMKAQDLLPMPPVVIKTHDMREIALAFDRKQRQQCVFGLVDARKPKRVILPEAWVLRQGQIQWAIAGLDPAGEKKNT
jgi:hypothetical protein